MLKRLFIAMLSMFIGVAVVYIHSLPGSYVLISLGNTSIETSLGVALAALVLCVLVLWLLRYILGLFHPGHVRNAVRHVQTRQHRSRLNQALVAHLLGKHQRTRDLIDKSGNEVLQGFTRYALQAENKISANHLISAQQPLTRLEQLAKTKDEKELARRLRAKWLLAKKDYNSLNSLALPERVVAMPFWNQLLALSAEKSNDKQKLLRILQKSHSNNATHWCALVTGENALATEKIWRLAPQEVQHNPQFAESCLLRFAHEQDRERVQKLLLRASSVNALTPLLSHVGSLAYTRDSSFLLKLEKNYVLSGENNQPLAFALGKLCMDLQLWGKAKDYLHVIADNQASPLHEQARIALAKLLAYTGDNQQAVAYLQQGDDQPTARDDESQQRSIDKGTSHTGVSMQQSAKNGVSVQKSGNN